MKWAQISPQNIKVKLASPSPIRETVQFAFPGWSAVEGRKLSLGVDTGQSILLGGMFSDVVWEGCYGDVNVL